MFMAWFNNKYIESMYVPKGKILEPVSEETKDKKRNKTGGRRQQKKMDEEDSKKRLEEEGCKKRLNDCKEKKGGRKL